MKRLILLFLLSMSFSNVMAQESRGIQLVERLGQGAITDAAWSPDGETLAVAGSIGIWLYDAGDMQQTPQLLNDEETSIQQVTFSQDSRMIAGRTSAGRFYVMAAGGEAMIYDLPDAVGQFVDMVYTLEGELLAVTIHEATAHIWHVTGGQELFSIEQDFLTAASFHREGRSLIIADVPDRPMGGGAGRLLEIWDIPSQTVLRVLNCFCSEIIGIAMSDDAELIAAIREEQLELWNVDSGETLLSIKAEGGFDFEQVAISPDGTWLVARQEEDPFGGDVRLWNIQTGEEVLLENSYQNGDINSLVFAPDSRQWVSASSHNLIVRNTTSEQESFRTAFYSNSARFLAMSADGNVIATTTGSMESAEANHIRIWDIQVNQDEIIPAIIQPTSSPSTILLSRTGDHLYQRDPGPAWNVYNVASGERLIHFEGELIDINSDGTLLAQAQTDGTVSVLDATTGEQLAQVEGQFKTFLTFHPQLPLLATGTEEGVVQLVNINTGAAQTTLTGEISQPIFRLAFNADGTVLAAGYEDGQIQLWDVVTGQLLRELNGHTRYAYRLSFSPDGRWLASSGRDEQVFLWGLSSEISEPVLLGNADIRNRLSFSSDSQHILSVGWQYGIQVWNVQTQSRTTNIFYGDFMDAMFVDDQIMAVTGHLDGTVSLWEFSSELTTIARADMEQLSDVNILAYCDTRNERQPVPRINQSVSLFWSWFATETEYMNEHLAHGAYSIRLDGERLRHWQYRTEMRRDPINQNHWTVYFYMPIGQLAPGEHTVEYIASWHEPITDGLENYGPDTANEHDVGTCTFQVTE